MTVMVATTKLNKIEMFTCYDFSYSCKIVTFSRNSHKEYKINKNQLNTKILWKEYPTTTNSYPVETQENKQNHNS